jgi:hypothetical protein
MQITDIITSQNLFLDLVESEADRNTLNHNPRVFCFDQVELTIEAPCGLTLDIEGGRPGKNLISEDQCTVWAGIFRNERGKLATKLEEHIFVPHDAGHGTVSWQEADGPSFTPQQLCDFAFRRLRETRRAMLRY